GHRAVHARRASNRDAAGGALPIGRRNVRRERSGGWVYLPRPLEPCLALSKPLKRPLLECGAVPPLSFFLSVQRNKRKRRNSAALQNDRRSKPGGWRDRPFFPEACLKPSPGPLSEVAGRTYVVR